MTGGWRLLGDELVGESYRTGIATTDEQYGELWLQVGMTGHPPIGVPDERTVVAADLSEPGAVATTDQIGPDQSLIDASQQPQPVDSGGFVEPGYPAPYRLYVHCGIAVLGELNGIWWMNGTGAVPVPPEWAELINPNTETITVEVTVTAGPAPMVTATANGHSVNYQPVTREAVPGCD